MTADKWRTRVRRYLRDTGRGYSTDRKFFQDEEIAQQGTLLREKLLASLHSRPPESAQLTICRSVKQVSGSEGAPIPDDLFILECGIRANVAGNDPQGFIPVRKVPLGEQMQGMDGIYADGALFHGTADKAIYYAKPASDLSGTAALTDFPDAFYSVLATMTAMTLTLKRAESFYKTRTPEGSYKSKRLEELLFKQIRTLR